MFKDEIKNAMEIPVDAKNDLKVALKYLVEGQFKTTNVCFPACVYEGYDKQTRTIKVMPLVKYRYYDTEAKKTKFARRQPFPMFVRKIRCGGFAIEVPLHVGDTGWVIASDRITTDIREKGRKTTDVLAKDVEIGVMDEEYQSEPEIQSDHSFLSGFFIPDSWSDVNYADRFKDAPNVTVDSNRDLYIGTSLDTKETYEPGEEYDKRCSCSIVMKQNEGMTGGTMLAISQSSPKEEGKYATIQFGDSKIKIIVKGEGEGEGDGEDATKSNIFLESDYVGLHMNIKGKERAITADKDGVYIKAGDNIVYLKDEGISLFGNVTVYGTLAADEMSIGGKKITVVGLNQGNLMAQ